MKTKSFMAISLLLACLLSACAGSAGATLSPTATTQSSIAEALPNSKYLIDCTSSGNAQLKDGSFEEQAAPGSASFIKVQLGQQSFGDINGDGLEDAAVTLIADTGGSGTFTYLALVVNDNGTARPLPAVLLGDRIEVKSLTIHPILSPPLSSPANRTKRCPPSRR
jgi:hypothetical protein